jgi:hypothetical membrane protein
MVNGGVVGAGAITLILGILTIPWLIGCIIAPAGLFMMLVGLFQRGHTTVVHVVNHEIPPKV